MAGPNQLLYQECDSPLGRLRAMVACAEGAESLCLLEFDHPDRISREASELAAAFACEPRAGRAALHDEIEQQLGGYFAGDRRRFDLPLSTPGTAFRQRVWRELLAIPHGHTRSYAEIARAVGAPGAQRAVGAANGANRIAIVVPCHRVVEAGGGLRGYGGGLDRKRWLLEHEGARPAAPGLFDAPRVPRVILGR